LKEAHEIRPKENLTPESTQRTLDEASRCMSAGAEMTLAVKGYTNAPVQEVLDV
jgi:hypothetical protein